MGNEIFHLFALTWAGLKDYRKAWEYSQMELVLSDSIHTAETDQKIAEIHARYQTEKKEAENQILRQEKELKNFQLKKEKKLRQNIILSGTISLFFFITLLVIVYLFYRDKSKYARNLAKNNQIIESQKTALQYTLNRLSRNEAKLMEANATKDKFFSIIAHDLKNPFSSIIGYSDLLSESYLDFDEKEKRTMIRQINTAAGNTYRLLENLLQWSRSQMVLVKHEPEIFHLHAAVDENINLIKDMAAHKNIILASLVGENLKVYANRETVDVVIRNLVSNAVKFTERNGSVKVEALSNEHMVKVTVSDTGTGMSDEEKQKVFRIEAGFRKPGTEKETGTGLGLILCKEFVEKNGRSICVESEIGKGSRFIFTLPLAD